MREIINRVTLTVGHKFVAGAPFQVNLPVGFNADEFIVRQISYGTCATDGAVSVIQTNLIRNGDGIIGQVFTSTYGESLAPNSVFIPDITKINTGSATFSILIADTLIANTPQQTYITNTLADGRLAISLEFVQYKK